MKTVSPQRLKIRTLFPQSVHIDYLGVVNMRAEHGDWAWMNLHELHRAFINRFLFMHGGLSGNPNELRVHYASFYPPGHLFTWVSETMDGRPPECFEKKISVCPFPSSVSDADPNLSRAEDIWVSSKWGKQLLQFASWRMYRLEFDQSPEARHLAYQWPNRKCAADPKWFEALDKPRRGQPEIVATRV